MSCLSSDIHLLCLWDEGGITENETIMLSASLFLGSASDWWLVMVQIIQIYVGWNEVLIEVIRDLYLSDSEKLSRDLL